MESTYDYGTMPIWATSPEANAETILPYNLPYKWRRMPSSGIFACLHRPYSGPFVPSGPLQKDPLDRIISSFQGNMLEDLKRRGVL
jgi:hypothetical protein